jgi:hypothetical protein
MAAGHGGQILVNRTIRDKEHAAIGNTSEHVDMSRKSVALLMSRNRVSGSRIGPGGGSRHHRRRHRATLSAVSRRGH